VWALKRVDGSCGEGVTQFGGGEGVEIEKGMHDIRVAARRQQLG